MALNKKPPRRVWSHLHFLVRLAGLTGLLAGSAGLALVILEHGLDWPVLRRLFEDAWDRVRTAQGVPVLELGLWMTLGGLLAAGLAAIVEAIGVLRLAAGRRSAFGINVALQVALAFALVVGINVYSFEHHQRFDWTRGQQFTLSAHLPASVLDQLRQVKDQTTIVVYQQHKTFGHLSDKPDAYDYAAERKVVEKVQDLVEQFRDLGPRFRVVVLDVEEDKYNDKLAEVTRDADDLRKAIDSAAENSIFFYAPDRRQGGKVQQLSFNEFYQLDKTASRAANGGRGNLVLLSQGPEIFARKVLNIEEKRPRVAVAVTFEVLATEGPEMYGLRGLKKTLTARGFDVRDVILKKVTPMGGVEPAAYTYEESRFGSLEVKLTVLDAVLKEIDREIQDTATRKELVEKGTDQGLARALALKVAPSLQAQGVSVEVAARQLLDQLQAAPADEKAELRRRELAGIDQDMVSMRKAREQFRQQREKRSKEREELNDESFAEQRRSTDVKVKLERLLDDCDLLIVPRMTILSLAPALYIPNEVHRLDATQVQAIQDFLKAGKPVLACFGPANESPGRRRRSPSPAGETDGLEELLGKLGIKFGKQTVLFDVEAETLATAQDDELEVPAAPEPVPPVDFDPKGVEGTGSKINPIRASMRVATRGVGKSLNLEIRYPRPITYEAPRGMSKGGRPTFGDSRGEGKSKGQSDDPLGTGKPASAVANVGQGKNQGRDTVEAGEILPFGLFAIGLAPVGRGPLGAIECLLSIPRTSKGNPKRSGDKPEVEAAFMMTPAESWKEDQPFPVRGRPLVPGNDRRGPFPIGVAIETPIPGEWYNEQSARPAARTVRVAAMGHGGWFVGNDLSPTKEKLLVDVCDWLLHRDELLAREDRPQWSYPRAQMDERTQDTWHWGTQLGLPMLFVYLGLVVLLVRRLR